MLFNILGFNISWFGLVWLGNSFIPVTLLWLLLHLYLCKYPLAECKLIACIALLGISVDSILSVNNILVFTSSWLIPFWLITLWLAFAATIGHSLSFLSSSKKWQAIVGFIFPPLSYIAGSKITSVSFGVDLVTTYLVLGTLWSMLFVLFFYLKKHFTQQEISHE